MNDSRALVPTALHPVEPIWDQRMYDLVKATVCKGSTDAEFELFVATCTRTRLDPLARQIYSVRRRVQEDGAWREAQVIQISIDGARLLAERTSKYGGQLGPFWCGPDGEWREVWLADTPPAAARVGVIRLDWREPLWAVARWASYANNRDGQPTRMWASMPDLMLAKCSESLALRRAFPAELSGLYAAEEMAQAENVEPPGQSAQPTSPAPIRGGAASPEGRHPPAAPPPLVRKGECRVCHADSELTSERVCLDARACAGRAGAIRPATHAAFEQAVDTTLAAAPLAPRYPWTAAGKKLFLHDAERDLGLTQEGIEAVLGTTIGEYLGSKQLDLEALMARLVAQAAVYADAERKLSLDAAAVDLILGGSVLRYAEANGVTGHAVYSALVAKAIENVEPPGKLGAGQEG